ncbi:4Fe-4S binding protein [Nitratiruptor sp. SB155-2]|uniref:4Fe-4S binding protein n=1 Tax=Nitratiruptor sp. (strain SB155-2) TaxID=387092 RepID=UPI0001587163|nr:4Fe-4S binding protein [Nitratiruptor sp. SB155-2]BAF70909.1 periplasmic nitrate reductase, ferredoxin-type protein NapF [Nitratiruptor sp. SB155-2]
MERRELFTALLRKKRGQEEQKLLYPPYYNDVSDFEKCKECESKPCIEACEENIIVICNDKPTLDFSESGCTFCDACAEVCESGVLDMKYKSNIEPPKLSLLGCLAWQKTICSMCKDICEVNAIDFVGLFNPEINEKCTGCGFCLAVCPTKAIRWE